MDDDNILLEFLVESHENLDHLNQDLLELEQDPSDSARLANVFRTIHTLKGNAGFLALTKLEFVTHHGENLLVALRDGELELTNDVSDGLFSLVDAVREILASLESSGAEGDAEYDALIRQLESLRCNEIGHEVKDHAATQPSEHPPESTPEQSNQTPAAQTSDKAATLDAESRIPSAAESTVRLDVEMLDELMNRVGELVLTRNQILDCVRDRHDPQLLAASQRLDLITRDLQAGVLKTRMRPIRHAWSNLPRVVRDLAQSCQKQVNVVMEGADTELDKTILEAIKDPLTHIVRNSVDHGIELPKTRLDRGKPVEATLLLRASHEAGLVQIEVTDDGGGIDLERVRSRAVTQSIVTAEHAQQMSAQELIQLILAPGFSTATLITNVSGRGVGMDVVKTNVEALGGTLDVLSKPELGTTIRIRIPLTLAIVPALIVGSQDQQFAIPQVNLKELVRLEGDDLAHGIELLHDVPVYRLREQLLPLLYLDEQLLIHPRRTVSERRNASVANIVIVEADDHRFGLVVDDIHDTQEVVVKPLGLQLTKVPVYGGATIMGDGSVSLILNMKGLAERGNLLGSQHESISQSLSPAENPKFDASESWLIVNPGDDSRTAIALSSVSRLEDFSGSQIEQIQGWPVLNYRNSPLPLVTVNNALPKPDQAWQVVVFEHEQRKVGLVVKEIVDVVEHPANLSDGPLNSVTQVIEGQLTHTIDLHQLASRLPVTGASQ